MATKLGTLFIIAAPSGAGKTTLVKAVVDTTPDIKVSVSHTTRARRPGEQDQVNYYFVSSKTFNAMVEANEFLEHATVFGNFYGTSRKWVEATLLSGIDVILEIDWQGTKQVRQNILNAVTIFILPPSLTTLRERLEHRNQDDPEVINSRMALAKQEMQHYGEFDYIVINDNFDQAVLEVRSIVISRRLEREVQKKRYSTLIQGLLNER